ncbi:cytochrome c oxidase accessory protein CcoG [Helicobacter sp. MIT 14-3879]|uniref:cytochrome c oxidase accessory protein CcoG n=1 Tax=Helicobacter sp. MIT 14-3879 TaxID=2040649 RepID=UPI000E1F1668|nr:cytochrome c oxidase accessory protein CcoG [Helicobacter sp. MIT 14-3879]RDU64207.1 cytochrome c oxidase accessory protein CcoG [Helicobacter sp. MIT 14-3879]
MENTIGKLNKYFRMKRYAMYIITTIVILSIPFIKINGNQIFLLSFDKKQLHLLGIVFDMQELYIMPFLVITLFVGIFLLTTLAGRAWCGWACPHTIFRVIYRDIIETKLLKLRKSIQNKQINPDLSSGINKIKKIISIFIWLIISLIAASNFLFYFVPPSDFFTYVLDYKNHMILFAFLVGITMFLTLEIIFIGENFCIYICPYCRVQSVLYDNDTKTVIYNTKRGSNVYDKDGNLLDKSQIDGECIACNKCVRVCPTHIDIRKGLQLECINCLECADACSSVMDKLNKKTLVYWSSTNAINTNSNIKYFRGKTIGYMIVIAIVLGISLILSQSKSNMLLNINRTAESYKILDNGDVENHYTMLFQNTDNKPHSYYFRILDNDNILIKKPSESFNINPGEKVRKRVFLYTNKNLYKGDNKDSIIPIKIMAYSTDDININIIKESIFVYPKK